jgi:glutamyl/glutaminyl-tRNA synthetase
MVRTSKIEKFRISENYIKVLKENGNAYLCQKEDLEEQKEIIKKKYIKEFPCLKNVKYHITDTGYVIITLDKTKE